MMRVHSTPRSGATLTEVLMALLIMSVGVVSVFSLFPISILSSIKANQVTNGKILADNVIEMVRSQPEVLHPGLPATFTWQGQWEGNRSYVLDDVVWPVIESGRLFPNPHLAYRCTTAGTSGATEPTWTMTGTTNDGSALVWTPMAFSATNDNQHYVIDPLGRHRDGNDSRVIFGGNGGSFASTATRDLRRSDAGYSDFTAAVSDFALPDTWSVAFEAVPTSVGSTVTFPGNTELPALTNDPAVTRVILEAANGRTAVRTLANSVNGGNTLTLNSGIGSGFNSNVRIETFTPRYTFFMTVRRPSVFVQPTVSVVVVFNRSYSIEGEEIFDANFGNSAYDDVTTVQEGALNTDQVKISWSTEGEPPLMREGSYIFDARACVWYQITDLAVDAPNQDAVITLDRDVVEVTRDTGSAADVGRAMFIPGIVGIYEL